VNDKFPYADAFSRNIGWVTVREQEQLRNSCVAIAGMGGVGGVHLLTLARLGVGRFRIADFDTFDVVNFNRQAGATVSTLGQPKVEVLARMALDINPDLQIERFPAGVSADNVDRFLAGVDLYVDGLDFFAFGARELTFGACARLKVPAVTVAPLGMGAGLLNFLPGQMSFEDYFQWAGQPEDEKALRFLVGLAPAGLHRGYLVDPSVVSLVHRRTPSTIMGCQLCAGVAATEALKILLADGRRSAGAARPRVLAAPHGMQFDAYRNRLARTWRPGGNRNPLQRLAMMIGRRQLDQIRQTEAAAARGNATA
jgi:molybdopterin/thiamine biosynthesis adenylyltransferase